MEMFFRVRVLYTSDRAGLFDTRHTCNSIIQSAEGKVFGGKKATPLSITALALGGRKGRGKQST